MVTHIFVDDVYVCDCVPLDNRRDAEYASADAFYRKNKKRRVFFNAFMRPWVIDAVRHKAATALINQHMRRAANSWIEAAASRRATRDTMAAVATSMRHLGLRRAMNSKHVPLHKPVFLMIWMDACIDVDAIVF